MTARISTAIAAAAGVLLAAWESAMAESTRVRAPFSAGVVTAADVVRILAPAERPSGRAAERPTGAGELSAYVAAGFVPGSAELPEAAKRHLALVAEAMSAPGLGKALIVVEWHTDAGGDAAFNDALSLARARSAAGHLVALGVPRSRLALRGMGETDLLSGIDPLAPEQRRIEFVRRFDAAGTETRVGDVEGQVADAQGQVAAPAAFSGLTDPSLRLDRITQNIHLRTDEAGSRVSAVTTATMSRSELLKLVSETVEPTQGNGMEGDDAHDTGGGDAGAALYSGQAAANLIDCAQIENRWRSTTADTSFDEWSRLYDDAHYESDCGSPVVAGIGLDIIERELPAIRSLYRSSLSSGRAARSARAGFRPA